MVREPSNSGEDDPAGRLEQAGLANNSCTRFEATIEKRGSGHMLEIPFDVKEEWGKARAPVAAEINGHTFRSTVAVYGGRYLLGLNRDVGLNRDFGLNRDVRESAGVRAGDRVVVELELDTAERVVEQPPELRAACADPSDLPMP